ncbi:MAG: DUF922 domain-containing protein [Desulfobacterales bacterium]|nr:DUF922 domain-containing protein [Desulfobacterales bacterium]
MKKRERVEEMMRSNKKENRPSRIHKADFSQPSGSIADRVIFLQKTIGNQAVERLINSEHGGSISHTLQHNGNNILQRYRVPGHIRCSEIVDWLNGNSPYAPEWAQTRCTYSFIGNLRMNGNRTNDGYEISVKGHRGLSVSVNCPIDGPSWSPTRRTNRNAEVSAWGSMRAALEAHEQRHRQIGQRWRQILETRFRAIDFTVHGSNERDARQKVREQIAQIQQEWISDAQNAQDAIDPFEDATLSCP